MAIHKTYNIILSLLFLVIIFSFSLIFIFGNKKEINLNENRALKQAPEIKPDHLDAFPEEFESFFNDHFAFRNQIIKIYNLCILKTFKKSPDPGKVLIGIDDWLFQTEHNLEVYQGKVLFNKDELSTIKKELEYRADFCEKRGAEFYFIIAPHKYSIYEEYIPKYYRNKSGLNLKTQIISYLNGNEKINILDLTEVLLKNKDKGILYYKTDTHWNSLGAYYAANCVLNWLKKDFPGINEIKIEDYNISSEKTKGKNISDLISSSYLYTDEDVIFTLKKPSKSTRGEKSNYKATEGFPYPSLYEIVKVNPDAPPLKVLIIRDSFANYQIPFFQETFGKLVCIFDSWQHKLNEEIIENEKPDIVIIHCLEDQLESILHYRSIK